MITDSIFIEQAEYITSSNFESWSGEHPNEDIILKKLTYSGAKLLTGPRGCGKTTLMLKAFNKILLNKNSRTLPIYVNFKSSLKLEPIYKKKANGGFWFSQWMYLKIIEGAFNSLDSFNPIKGSQPLPEDIKKIRRKLDLLELGEIERPELLTSEYTVSDIEYIISNLLESLKKTRCVLLLDDAAHAFSPEQQADFFEFFRKIKSSFISPKAAIYPGVTSFAPTFHVGHDAEEIDAWINPEDPEYLSFMTGLLQKRLPPVVFSKLEAHQNLLNIVCFTAFGIPRQLLNMVRSFYQEDDEQENPNEKFKVTFTKSTVLKQVKLAHASSLAVYLSLQQKLPTFSNYIAEGEQVYSRILDSLKLYNKDKVESRKSFTIAIKKEIDSDLKKILGFFMYSGLASYKGNVSKGEKGVFERYLINFASMVDKNAVMAAKALNVEKLSLALSSKNAHDYNRVKSENLLSKADTSIKLKLPPCTKCNAERSNENARFCSSCGSPLKSSSIYETLINQDISNLPLTDGRVKSIGSNSNIKTIADILYDIGHKELKKVPQIGRYWSEKIYRFAEEYIS
jgi:hypothetical protein